MPNIVIKYEMLNSILSFYNNPFMNFSGPFNIAKETNMETQPKLKRLLNFEGTIIIKGRKVREINISSNPIEKNIINYFHVCAAYYTSLTLSLIPF